MYIYLSISLSFFSKYISVYFNFRVEMDMERDQGQMLKILSGHNLQFDVTKLERLALA